MPPKYRQRTTGRKIGISILSQPIASQPARAKNQLSGCHKTALHTFLKHCFSLFLIVYFVACIAASRPLSAETQHAIAMHGAPKYTQDFKHFDYVNPSAPNGGSVRLAIEGSFDSLNPLIIKGVSGAGLREFVFESLMARGLDEAFTLYPLLAEKIEVPDDRSAITFHLNPEAKFSDGNAVDADDLLFSWRVLKDKGRPNHRAYYSKVTNAVRISDHAVRFELGTGSDRELPLILGLMPILPSHIYNYDTFEQTTLDMPIGSGPYIITKVDPGRSIVFSRNKNWWGKDLPVAQGRFNFDEIQYEYFRDGNSMFEAFKSGQVDLRPEEDPARWAEGYNIPALRDGEMVKGQFKISLPAGMTGLVFNTRRKVFANPHVRQALNYLFDFSWINRGLYHGLYARTQSYFERSELSSHRQRADEREKSLLGPFADAVKPKVLDGTYSYPKGDGTGRNRQNWKKAIELLKKGGYELRDGKMINSQSGEQLTFEMLAVSLTQRRLFTSFARDLRRLGINVKVRVVDSAQYQSRQSTYDFDMIQFTWPASLSPGNEQIFRWSSKMAKRDGTFNFAGVENKAADAMIDAMLSARSREDFVSAVRALDRVLISGDYVIPLFHLPKQWVAYWAHLAHPQQTSLFGYQLDTWWSKKGDTETSQGQPKP